MKSADVPPIPAALLEDLEKRFPNKLTAIPTGCTLDEVRLAQGQQLVIGFLRRQFDIQNKTVLEG